MDNLEELTGKENEDKKIKLQDDIEITISNLTEKGFDTFIVDQIEKAKSNFYNKQI